MIKILSLLLLAQFTVPMHTGALAGGAGASIAYIANASGTGSAGTGSTTGSLNVTAGDKLIVFCVSGGANNTMTMTDTIGNTFGKGTHQNDASIGNTDMFYAVSSASNAADSFTCTNSNGANNITLVALQYRGGASSGIADVLTNNAGISGAWTTSAFNTSAAQEVVVQCAEVGTYTAAGQIGGVTAIRRFDSGVTSFDVSCQDVIFSSIQTSITASITIVGSSSYNGQMGAFK
jgi:hypothetical protein